MVQKLDTLTETPSQTAGPYVHIGTAPTYAGLGGIYEHEIGQTTYQDGAEGEVIEITGTVTDGTGWVLRDAVIEVWQADASGRFAGQEGADPKVTGWARVCADPESGEWRLGTIKPGPVPMRGGGWQAPHIVLWIVARGINTGLQSRIYFEDEANGDDPVLARIEQRPRVDTLIAKKTGDGRYRFDIRLQGAGETVFFDM
ncbi:protocatechuate 3,4-dioxygenase alpha subunit [Rhodovulum iodosum]|uniref:Protocatechuate 3,4-dioxygenase alpha subunit n=1 Tax=Rhodovulum iodosum TaxID=68291 RepID=A0ABV3XNY8_9RHOB|nr:protocatechuate 3,4-dioxygenase subunit alpha [Rhodovulum robiginosum]RSK35889.1 protocatechuate 3,4-dioxygenase subunit alpha [Rhodovulum robiginosum]